MAQPPNVDDLLEYLALTGANYPADQAQEALDVALEAQAAVCVVWPYTSSLREAALRRAGRYLAGRGAPLGQVDLGQFGPALLPRWDALIEEFERDYRQGGFA